MPVIRMTPAPATAMTITSDPERPAATAGGAAEGTMRIDPTLMFAVKTRTDPDASVPVALNVNVPDADVGIVTFAESAPVTSVSAVANSIGADVTTHRPRAAASTMPRCARVRERKPREPSNCHTGIRLKKLMMAPKCAMTAQIGAWVA